MSHQKLTGFAVKEIMTHHRPHPDELWAIYLLIRYGEEKYPGISTAPIVFSGIGNQTPDGRPIEDWEAKGKLFVGMGGGGRFDEHCGSDGRPSKRHDCALTLVVKDLELDGDPGLRRIIPYVRNEDLNGTNGDMFTFAETLKALYRYQQEKDVVAMALKIIDSHYQADAEFADAENILHEAKVLKIGTNGQTIKVMAVESGNPSTAKACRRQGANLIVQRQPTGNVQIYVDKNRGLDLRNLVRLLRIEEAKCQRRDGVTDWKLLESEGKDAQVGEEWFYHKEGGWILNGSLSTTDVPPTKIPTDRILRLVEIAFDPEVRQVFHQESQENCRHCGLFSAGLVACRKERFERQSK